MSAPSEVERRARWVLDTLGARDTGFGDDVPYVAEAWESVARGERPVGDDLAEAFFHLARLEEKDAKRDAHGRFPGTASCLDPLDPPAERLRRKLGAEPPRWAGARFAVCLTHDVDTPWRWTQIGMRGAAARLRNAARAGRGRQTAREARALAAVPVHKVRGTDPNWCFERLLQIAKARGVAHTFYLMAGHGHPADGAAPHVYERLRPRLVEVLLAGGAEIGLHGSYTAADDLARLAEEKRVLESLAGPLSGHRYHYLRVDPHRNLTPLAELGFRYDTSLGFSDLPGFRAGIAHPFRPWDVVHDRPADLIEIPWRSWTSRSPRSGISACRQRRPSACCSSSSRGQRSMVAVSPCSGTTTASTRERREAGIVCSSASSTRCASAAASASLLASSRTRPLSGSAPEHETVVYGPVGRSRPRRGSPQ